MSSSAPARQQTWSTDTYGKHGRFVADLAGAVVEWLDPQPGERILDLGCGDGALTEKLSILGADVLGVDASVDLLDGARARGLVVEQVDGHRLPFVNEFDAVFSNAALHWMTEPDRVLVGVHRALKSGGRFVGEFGGHGNVAAIITAMRATARRRGGNEALAGPWFFPSADDYQKMLEHHGFTVPRIELIPRPTPLKSGMREWLKLFRKPFFEQFADQADDVLAEVEDLLRPVLRDGRGNWTADYVRLRFEAIKGS